MANITLTGVELYRHSADLTSHDRTWCNANATLRYSGTNQAFNDTGLTASTTYYYKLFAKYDVDGETFYSTGVITNEVTGAAPPELVSASVNNVGGGS